MYIMLNLIGNVLYVLPVFVISENWFYPAYFSSFLFTLKY